jgi:hypothetical protein
MEYKTLETNCAVFGKFQLLAKNWGIPHINVFVEHKGMPPPPPITKIMAHKQVII